LIRFEGACNDSSFNSFTILKAQKKTNLLETCALFAFAVSAVQQQSRSFCALSTAIFWLSINSTLRGAKFFLMSHHYLSVPPFYHSRRADPPPCEEAAGGRGQGAAWPHRPPGPAPSSHCPTPPGPDPSSSLNTGTFRRMGARVSGTPKKTRTVGKESRLTAAGALPFQSQKKETECGEKCRRNTISSSHHKEHKECLGSGGQGGRWEGGERAPGPDRRWWPQWQQNLLLGARGWRQAGQAGGRPRPSPAVHRPPEPRGPSSHLALAEEKRTRLPHWLPCPQIGKFR